MFNHSLNLLTQDLKHIWHPCSQMKEYETFKPLIIQSAQDSYFILEDGKRIIDAISSWWCKSLGHNHPRLKAAMKQQMECFEHVIFADTTYKKIISLSSKLANLTPNLNKVFFAGDGACAVEIALKMSLHARQIQGDKNKKHFIALKNSYHGETAGALSVSDLGIYRKPYEAMLFDVKFIDSIPYVNSTKDPLWSDCQEYWPEVEKYLNLYAKTTSALIVEPIVQGSCGMKIYSQDFLKKLREWTKAHDIHLIADEIMTGMGRTGKMLACEHAGIEPDFICLSKGLTSGWMPFSVVLTGEVIYNLFYDDYAQGKSFLHSHTFSGNALAASIALEVLNIMQEENILEKVSQLEEHMLKAFLDIAEYTNKITNIRSIGAIVAGDLIVENTDRRLGQEVYQKAVELGALLRPLGNTIYWLPPLTTSLETITELKEITQKALLAVKF